MTTAEHHQTGRAIVAQMESGPLRGHCPLTGATVDDRGKLAALKASLAGVTDPAELRRISREARR